MKTKDLIKELQDADPTGNLEVSVGNADIGFVSVLPGYYDGSQQILLRDGSKVVGGRYNSSRDKVTLTPYSFRDAVWDKPDLNIDYSDLSVYRQNLYKENLDKVRKESVDFGNKLEFNYFLNHLTKRAAEISSNLEGLEEKAKEFFSNYLSPADEFPADFSWKDGSYVDRRNKQWNCEIALTYDGFSFKIERI